MKELSLHILDIVQNSVAAGAKTISVEVIDNINENLYSITITDDGSGMSKEEVEKVIDPFYTTRTTRKVGLGIPLLKQNAESTGGTFTIETQKGKGTKVCAIFKHNHVDRPVMGDIAGVIVSNMVSYDNIRWIYRHKTPYGEYAIDSEEVKEALEGVSLNQNSIIKLIVEMINENLKEINFSE